MIRNLDRWIFPYLQGRILSLLRTRRSWPVHVAFCAVDHFEPFWGKADGIVAKKRVKSWIEEYSAIADRHADSEGMHPRHTFFYPQEEYEPELLEMLAGLCGGGHGEVEIHLHHDDDTSEGTRQKLFTFTELLAKKHGLLSTDQETGEIKYGFIHGNWALDNSRRDGRWCGVNDELTILQETGCYADFTLPSAPSDTQTKKINSIYYAIDDPNKPKSHDRGIDAVAGGTNQRGLLMIQGPLCLNWHSRKFGVMPRIESGSLSYDNPFSTERLELWVSHSPKIYNGTEWIFVKIHTHGCQEKNMNYLLFGGLDRLYSTLESYDNDISNYKLHYVSAREMFNLVKALEANTMDRLENWRDYPLRKNVDKV
jgi:hypothetical protein